MSAKRDHLPPTPRHPIWSCCDQLAPPESSSLSTCISSSNVGCPSGIAYKLFSVSSDNGAPLLRDTLKMGRYGGCNLIHCQFDRVCSQVRITGGGLDLGVPEQFPNHRQPMA